MKILSTETFNEKILEYYRTNYGEKDSDFWLEKPAENVCVFKREDNIVLLKAHILTGEVTEHVDRGRRV